MVGDPGNLIITLLAGAGLGWVLHGLVHARERAALAAELANMGHSLARVAKAQNQTLTHEDVLEAQPPPEPDTRPPWEKDEATAGRFYPWPRGTTWTNCERICEMQDDEVVDYHEKWSFFRAWKWRPPGIQAVP